MKMFGLRSHLSHLGIGLATTAMVLAGCGGNENSETEAKNDSEAVKTVDEGVTEVVELSPAEQKFAELNELYSKADVAFEGNPDEFSDRFLALANEFPQDKMAFASYRWIAKMVRDIDLKNKAYDSIIENYLESEQIETFCGALQKESFKNDKANGYLETIIEKSPHRRVQGIATYALANRMAAMPDSDEKRVDELFQRVLNEFGDVKAGRGTLKSVAEGLYFQRKYVGIGKIPEIEGVDLDGEDFKLSDYRGKVVLLDFWGDW